MFLDVRMFLCTVYEKFRAETSVQLGSDILVLLKCLAGRRGFNVILYSFLWYNILKIIEKPIQICFYCKFFWKRKYQVNNRVVILRTVDLTVWYTGELVSISIDLNSPHLWSAKRSLCRPLINGLSQSPDQLKLYRVSVSTDFTGAYGAN